jgi:hypothetical protein
MVFWNSLIIVYNLESYFIIKHGCTLTGYGFGFQRVDVFSKLLDECQEILDVKNPDALTWYQFYEPTFRPKSFWSNLT